LPPQSSVAPIKFRRDIPVPANPGQIGKITVKMKRQIVSAEKKTMISQKQICTLKW